MKKNYTILVVIMANLLMASCIQTPPQVILVVTATPPLVTQPPLVTATPVPTLSSRSTPTLVSTATPIIQIDPSNFEARVQDWYLVPCQPMEGGCVWHYTVTFVNGLDVPVTITSLSKTYRWSQNGAEWAWGGQNLGNSLDASFVVPAQSYIFYTGVERSVPKPGVGFNQSTNPDLSGAIMKLDFQGRDEHGGQAYVRVEVTLSKPIQPTATLPPCPSSDFAMTQINNATDNDLIIELTDFAGTARLNTIPPAGHLGICIRPGSYNYTMKTSLDGAVEKSGTHDFSLGACSSWDFYTGDVDVDAGKCSTNPADYHQSWEWIVK